MALHVPEPDPGAPEPPPADFLKPESAISGKKKEPDAPAATVREPALARPSVKMSEPAVAASVPPIEEAGGGTLRVSLITTGSEAGFSEIALNRRLRSFALVGVAGLLVDALIFGGLTFRQIQVEARNADIDRQVKDVDAQIAAREKALFPARDFQQLIRAEQSVLENHAHWSGVLRLLEETALPQVQFGGLSGAESGTLNFEVFARDYTTLAKQIVAFRQDSRVRKVVSGTASADFGENDLLKGVRAEMTLTVDPDVFKYAPEREITGSATATTS